MALSVIVIPGNGVTKQFSIPFSLGYLENPNFVTCRVGNEVDGTGAPVYRNLTFLSGETVVVSGAAPGVGVPVRFERTVPRDELLVNYEDDAIINEENMNTSQLQLIMLVQEIADGRFSQFQSNVDMAGNRFTNMGDPINAQDGATKAYVDASYSSNLANLNATIVARDAAIAARNQAATSASNSATSASESASSAAASEVSRQASGVSATNSANSATASQTSRVASETAKTASETARDVTLGYRNTAQTAATNSANSATASETSRQASGTSATNSANSATASASSASASETSRQASGTSATNSANSATASADSASTAAARATDAFNYRNNAYAWASNPENALVNDGTRTGYSSYHWAKKAEGFVGGGAFVQKSGDSMSGILQLGFDYSQLWFGNSPAGTGWRIIKDSAQGSIGSLVFQYSNDKWNQSYTTVMYLGSDAQVRFTNRIQALGGMDAFGPVNVASELYVKAAIELGKMDGTAGFAVMDFHTSATVRDYNCRIICDSNANDGNGLGTMNILAGNLVWNGNRLLNAADKATAADMAAGTANKFPDAPVVRDYVQAAIAATAPVSPSLPVAVALGNNTARQNNTGRPLMVYLRSGASGSTQGTSTLNVGSSPIVSNHVPLTGYPYTAGTSYTGCSAIVPPGAYYSYTALVVLPAVYEQTL